MVKSMTSLFRSTAKMVRNWQNLQKILTFQQRQWLQSRKIKTIISHFSYQSIRENTIQ